MPDPETASKTDLNIEKINIAQAYVDCRDGKMALIKWVVGMTSREK